MDRAGRLVNFAVTCLAQFPVAPPVADAQMPVLFVSSPTGILRLEDVTGDDDYLDFGEVAVYATLPGANLGPLAATTESLMAADIFAPIVWVARDLNDDGDALDFGELTCYLDESSCGSSGAWIAMAAEPIGGLMLADVDGHLFRATDTNGDGDALDFGECVAVASGLTAPRGLSIRPDGAVLVSQDSMATPVVILEDRNGDGDFLDFAEHLSYAESAGPGGDIVVTDQWLAFLLDRSRLSILRLQDLTQDGDALDAGEIVTHADPIADAVAMTGDESGRQFIASSGPSGIIRMVHDANGDGDALDFGEVIVVATDLGDVQSVAAAPASIPCIAGDANQDGSVTPADVPVFADALTGQSTIAMCALDFNGDGAADGRDITAFVAAVLDP
jgi:hypothetical protein